MTATPNITDKLTELAEQEHCCRTCRHWDVHSTSALKGDCRAPHNHRYSRVPMGDGSFAMLDSFGPEETLPGFHCGAWKQGQHDGPLDISGHAASLRSRSGEGQ